MTHVELSEPELRAILQFLPLDFEEDEPLGIAFRKLGEALHREAGSNDVVLGRAPFRQR